MNVRKIFFIAISFLSFFYGNAYAKDTYSFEYVRNDMSSSNIKKGTVLGTIYLKSQTISAYYAVTMQSFTIGELSFFFPPNSSYSNNAGCVPSGGDGSISLFMYRSTGRIEYCRAASEVVTAITNVPFNNLKFDPLYYSYTWDYTIPRTKLADVVVNDPSKALQHAGGAIKITLPNIAYSFHQGGWLSRDAVAKPESTLDAYIGESNPAVFFPSQSTSDATLNLDVNESGNARSSIDMCLYDGSGLSKPNYTLNFISNTKTGFSMEKVGGGGRIDYKVSITSPTGEEQNVIYNNPITWRNMINGGAAQGNLKYVQLPNGISGLVPCVPSTVRISVENLKIEDIPAGDYRGVLNILFTPSTT